jgi:hypothetical protein
MNTVPKTRDKYVPTIMLCVGGFLLVIGLFLFGIAMSDYLKATASKNWPTANATITTSTIEETMTVVKFRGMKPFYKPIIRYTYSVDGTSYDGDRIATLYPDGSIQQSWASGIVSQYPLNATVPVYYDPNRHDYAVLEPGLSSDNIFVFVLSSVFLVLGLVLTIASSIVRRKLAAGPVQQSHDDQRRAIEKKRTRASKAYLVGVVAWVVCGSSMIPLAVSNSETVAVVVAIVCLTTFVVGLAAIITGKALSDANKRKRQ